ncbi:MAG: alpha/beta fold hydrolase [Paracoccaceae bacterium]|nr:alpha/beta fold hydrolase [Paracoccaceae bacterium]
MSPEGIIAAISLLLAAEPDPAFDTLSAGGFDDRYPVTVAACPETTSALDIEGQTIICGTVDVPENHDAPDGNRIPLRFMVGKAQTTNPFSDPVLYLHGGPAGGAMKSIATVTDTILGDHRTHRDIVTFDQRAAMLSSTTVRCYDEISENILAIAREAEGVTPPEGTDAIDMDDFTKLCVNELYESEADLAQYNTRNNARDVRALMSALGYPEYNILGISYGTRLALEVLRTAPEGVRSVIIDGVAPPTVRLYDDLFPPHVDAMEALFDQCAADPDCKAAYPELREKFQALGDQLTATPIPAIRGRPTIDVETLYAVINARTKFSETWVRSLNNYLPRMIYELVNGDPSTFDWFIETYGEDTPRDVLAVLRGVVTLSDDEIALAASVLRSAQAMTDLSEGMRDTLAQLKHDISLNDAELSVAKAFDDRATKALQNMDRIDTAAAIVEYVKFQKMVPSRPVLEDWVKAHFLGPDRAVLLSLVAAMTPEDIARTFVIADKEVSPYQEVIQNELGLYIYACQEDFPYNSIAGYEASVADIPYSMIASERAVEDFKALFATCALFEPIDVAGFHEPVVSDIPVLSLGGTNDHQTSWRWSQLAAETLTNARVVIFPNSGHGSSLYSSCGRDMTARFILDPKSELDEECTADLLPKWVMPDAPLR